MSKNEMVMLPREVVEKALAACERSQPFSWLMPEDLNYLRAALEQPSNLYPLSADIYDSKDWRSGTYSERVEWLHTMYKSAKEQIAALEQPQPDQAPYLWYDPNNGDTWTQEAIDDGFSPTDNLIALYTK